MYKYIDTILLDLGGVLIDVDYRATARAFKALGFADFDSLYSKAKQDHLFDGFETGALSPAQFRDRLRQLHGSGITDGHIDECWNAMLGRIPQPRLDLVKHLRERYRVFLLSNTNTIHVTAFERIIAVHNGIADFKALFDGAYYSCEMGHRKPNADAYLHVLRTHDALPTRTLFIDDTLHHVEGARAAGLHAEHLDPAREDIIGLVHRLGLL